MSRKTAPGRYFLIAAGLATVLVFAGGNGARAQMGPMPPITPTPTPGPAAGSIYGVVFDNTPTATGDVSTSPAGVPLPGADVFVSPPLTGPYTSSDLILGHAVTDQQGRYRIDNLPTGVGLVARATKLGYSVDTKDIDGLTTEPMQVNFAIHRQIVPTITPTPTPTEPPPSQSGLCGLVVEQSMLTVIIPIPGALIEVYNAMEPMDGSTSTQDSATTPTPPPPVATAVADQNGHFCIVPLDSGWYFVKASADGYLPLYRQVFVPQDRTLDIVLALQPLPTPSPTPTPSPDRGTVFGQVLTYVPPGSLMPVAPIPGVEVLAFVMPPPPLDQLALSGDEPPSTALAGRAITGPDGNYAIPGLLPGSYLILARKDGFVPSKKAATVTAGERTRVDFALMRAPGPTPTVTPTPIPEAGSIHGLVFNALAMGPLPMPIPGVEVVVYPADVTQEGTTGLPLPILGRAITNDQGLYRIDNLPPIQVIVGAYKDGYMPRQVKAEVQPSSSTLVNIGLAPASPTPTPTPPPPTDLAHLSGRVGTLGSDGQPHPIQGAMVCLYDPATFRVSDTRPQPVACAETDNQGNYYLTAAPGDYAVVASALGFERQVKGARLQPGPNDPINFLLRPAPIPTPPPPPPIGKVEGVVVQWQDPNVDSVAAAPIPIPGALVTLYRADTTETLVQDPVARTQTDDQGRFVFNAVPVGLYIGVAEKQGYERDVKSFRALADQTVRVDFALKLLPLEPTPTPGLQPGGLAGRVVAAATDQTTTHPIAGALVTAFRIDRSDLADSAARPAGIDVTDADGLWHIPGLIPGEYLVVGVARGYESERVRANVFPGQITRVRIVLPAVQAPNPTGSGTLTGRVMTPSVSSLENQGPPMMEQLALDPVEGSTVTTYLITLNQTDPTLLTPSGRAVTDAQGRFRIDSLPPGLHLVVARASGYLPAVQIARIQADEVTNVQFVLLNANSGGIGGTPPTQIVSGQDPVDSSSAHWEVQTSSSFQPPTTDRQNGSLILRANGNTNCFGYWQSVTGWVPRVPNSLYEVSFTVASDQTDPSKSPSVRLRVNSDSLRQTDVFRISSLGDAGLAPTTAGTSYEMFFEPMDSGQVDPQGQNGLNVSFDLLNFDKNDAPNGELALTSLSIDAIPLDTLDSGTTVKEWTFQNGSAGWTVGSAPAVFNPPDAQVAGGALQLHASHQGNVFGYWSSPPDDFQAPASGALLRVSFHVTSNQVDPSQVTQLRVRLNSADGQVAVLKVVPSLGDGANSPTTAGRDYHLYFEVPPGLVGKGLIASLDFLGFDPQDAADNTLSLDQVTIDQLPAPAVN